MTGPHPGVWAPGDDPGQRRFARLFGEGAPGFDLEGGGHLPEVTVAYETWGGLAPIGATPCWSCTP